MDWQVLNTSTIGSVHALASAFLRFSKRHEWVNGGPWCSTRLKRATYGLPYLFKQSPTQPNSGGLEMFGTMEFWMTFPSYWEFHHPNWLSLHDFLEGLVFQSPDIDRSGMISMIPIAMNNWSSSVIISSIITIITLAREHSNWISNN